MVTIGVICQLCAVGQPHLDLVTVLTRGNLARGLKPGLLTLSQACMAIFGNGGVKVWNASLRVVIIESAA